MALKAGRVGVAPSEVDELGKLKNTEPVDLPIATTTQKGILQVGANLNINNGIISSPISINNLADINKKSALNLLAPINQQLSNNGITATPNGDGSYTINGTATNTAYIHLGIANLIQGKQYKVCGIDNYISGCFIFDNNYGIGTQDHGEGYIFTPKTNQTRSDITLYVNKDMTLTDYIIKPMVSPYTGATIANFAGYTGEGETVNTALAYLMSEIIKLQ